jgi:hypothetical protein
MADRPNKVGFVLGWTPSATGHALQPPLEAFGALFDLGSPICFRNDHCHRDA